MIAAALQADGLQHLFRFLAQLRVRQRAPRVKQRQLDIFQGRGAREQIEILKNESELAVAHVRQFVAAQGGNILAIEKIAAGRRPIEAAENIHQGRFARAARAHQRDEFASPDLDGNTADRMHIDFAGPIRFPNVLETNRDEIASENRPWENNVRSRSRRASSRRAAERIGGRRRRCAIFRHASDDAVAFLQTFQHFGRDAVADPCLDRHCWPASKRPEPEHKRCARSGARRERGLPPAAGRPPRGIALRRRGRSFIRHPKTKGAIRNLQHIIPMRGDDGNIRGHAGLQFLIRIADADDGVVRDHVLHRDRRIAHLHHLPVKGLRRKSVDREIHILIDRDAADVRFGHVRVDLHFREIVRDLENDRRLQARRHGLADVDISRNHDPIDRAK